MESKSAADEEKEPDRRKSWAEAVKHRVSYKKTNQDDDDEVELVERHSHIGQMYNKLSKRQSLL